MPKHNYTVKAQEELDKMDTSGMTEEQKKRELLRIYCKIYYQEHKQENNERRKQLYRERKEKVKELINQAPEAKMTTAAALLFLQNTEILTKTGKIKSRAVVAKIDQIIEMMKDMNNRNSAITN